jgi:protein-tyrosine phosphatase
MNEKHYPNALWSEILPGLWQGGTDDFDTKRSSRAPIQFPTKDLFDAVYTLYGHATGADWGVKELRFPFFDGDMTDFDPESDLWLLVVEAHADWKAGKRVLIRCQAGLNRSGLVMALTLIRERYSPQDAIDLMRQQRGPDAICNRTFERWLLNDADLEFCRGRMAA